MWLDSAPTSAPLAVAAPGAEIYYGGPDQAPRALRDVLKAKVDAAQPGSTITWATYYFHDQGLAESLVAAQKRGVRVRVRIEGSPRHAGANDTVIAALREGLGNNLKLNKSPFGIFHLHAKIYAFTGPPSSGATSEVLIGSFNPSGDAAENPKLLADIGNQDRGENLLVAFRDPAVTAALTKEADRLWSGKATSRFSRRENRVVRLQSVRFYYFPRLRPDVVERRIARLGPGDSVQAAISHMDQGPFAENLAKAAKRGAQIDLVVHDTARRVPTGVVKNLTQAGVHVRRYCDPEGLPMHAKFVVIDDNGERSAWFGSLNYNVTSRYLNQEILARSTDASIVGNLTARFRVISKATETTANACGHPPAAKDQR